MRKVLVVLSLISLDADVDVKVLDKGPINKACLWTPVLWVCLFLLSSYSFQPAFAIWACFQAQSRAIHQVPVLGDIRKNLDKTPVSQCRGTCYFESNTSAIGSKISKLLGQAVEVSRPHLFVHNLITRLKSLSEARPNVFDAPDLRSVDGLADFVSGGSEGELAYTLKNTSIHLISPRTQIEIYRENQIIQNIYNKVGEAVYNLLHSRKFPATGFKSDDEALIDQSYELKQAVEKISAEAERLLEESGVPEGVRIDNPKIKNLTYDLEFEDGPGGQVYLKTETEKRIVDQLEKGVEPVLSYFHVTEYSRTMNGHDGFMMLPEKGEPLAARAVFRRRKGGPHAISLVDVMRNSEGRIQYLVVRNSWGSRRRTDYGYNYISMAYLKHYRAAMAEINEWWIDPATEDQIRQAFQTQKNPAAK